MSPRDASRLLWLRLKQHWILKFVGITTFMWLFFTAYFVLLNHPQFPVTLMPLLPLDQLIGFQPASLALYLSLWVYVSIPPSLMENRRRLIYYGWAAAALCMTGLAIFFLWPTAVPPAAIDYSRHPGFAMLQGVDASGNACPSLHVASAVFSGIWIHRILREMKIGVLMQTLNWAWCLGIAYSTLATKQHVFIDAAAGALLGIVIGVLTLARSPKAG